MEPEVLEALKKLATDKRIVLIHGDDHAGRAMLIPGRDLKLSVDGRELPMPDLGAMLANLEAPGPVIYTFESLVEKLRESERKTQVMLWVLKQRRPPLYFNRSAFTDAPRRSAVMDLWSL